MSTVEINKPKSNSHVVVRVHDASAIEQRLPTFAQSIAAIEGSQQFHDPAWLLALRDGLRHSPYLIEARQDDKPVGFLALALVRSALFGRFLVSLPYINSAGVIAKDDEAARCLINRAVQLADELDVRYLELRHEIAITHPALQYQSTGKVHMRLPLPKSVDEMWSLLDPKVRNQIRKGQKSELSAQWGGTELLRPFYSVFSHNMRDLGTPVFSRYLFDSILRHFSCSAELCVVRLDQQPIAAAILVHGNGVTQVPSASSLRKFNSTNANMMMYWNLICRAIEQGQHTFDFGRSSSDSNTYRFKKQWGATPQPAVWQYYLRKGTIGDMRPDSPRYQRATRIWQRLPLWLANTIGPVIVRGIP